MINQFAYHASQARTDDLRRRAASELRATAVRRTATEPRRPRRAPAAWIAIARSGIVRAAVHGDRT